MTPHEQNRMMKHFLFCTCIFLSFFQIACGPGTPGEAEIRARIVGTYCLTTDANESYELSLADSTYQMTKNSPSIMRTGLMTEYCKGTYELRFQEKEWRVYFGENTSLRRMTIYDCKSDFLLWTEAQEYIGGEEPTLRDLFDGKELKKSLCEY